MATGDAIISDAFQRASNILLYRSIEEAEKVAFWKKFAKEVPSTAASEKYEWLQGIPQVEKWNKKRSIESFTKADYTITNETWQVAVGFEKNQLNDNPAIVKNKIPELAQAIIEHPFILILDSIMYGEERLCYDDKPFYSTVHPSLQEGLTYSNLLTQTAATVAGIKADFDLCEKAFLNMKNRRGGSLFAVAGSKFKYEILHSVDLSTEMAEVFDDEYLASALAKNKYYGRATHHPLARLSGNSWYICITGKSQTPFVFQRRSKPKAKWSLVDEFMENAVYYGVDYRGNSGYGHPQLGIKVVGS